MIVAIAFITKDNWTASSGPVADLEVSPDAKLKGLVVSLAEHSATMSLAEMESKLNAWRKDPSTLLDMPENERMQMLANAAHGISMHTSSLVDDSTLCAKKDIIISKFDQLLKKLGGEELALNISNGKINEELKAALGSWLDSESSYRLTVEKAKEATEGADYARNQYEKYNTAYLDAKKTLDQINKQTAEERSGLLDERDLIKQIMVMIGVLNDQEASAQDIAAGGKNSVKNEFGVSDPYATGSKKAVPAVSTAELKQKLQRLQALSGKVKQAKFSTMLNKLKSSLAEFAESDEVASILKQMLQDIEDRLRIITNLATSAKKTADDLEAKVIEWQTKLVELSTAKDKANAEAQAEQLQREQLAGQKKEVAQTASQENAAYKLLVTPYIKEIYVIQLIKTKILEHCAQAGA